MSRHQMLLDVINSFTNNSFESFYFKEEPKKLLKYSIDSKYPDLDCIANPSILLGLDNKDYASFDFIKDPIYIDDLYGLKIKQYNELMQKYIEIYQKLSGDINNFEFSIKIKVNHKNNNQAIHLLVRHTSLVEYKNNAEIDAYDNFFASLKRVHANSYMRCDPLFTSVKYIEFEIYNNESPLEMATNMFTLNEKGKYKESPLLHVIQSYLDLIGNDSVVNYSIYDPLLIESPEMIDTLINLVDISRI